MSDFNLIPKGRQLKPDLRAKIIYSLCDEIACENIFAILLMYIAMKICFPFYFLDSSTKSPPLIKHVSTYLGQTVKLPCAVISFPISVVWYHGKRPVTSSPRVKIRKKKLALVIKSITRNDVGNYTCVAKGIMHRTSHNNMTYIVSVMSGASPSPTVVTWKKPSVTATYRRPAWNKLTVKIGDNVTLSCKAPKNEVHFLLWYVEGRPIKAGVVGYQTNHSIVKKLTLFNVSVENQYTCMAYPPRTDYKYPVQVVTLKFSTGMLLFI